MTPSGIVLLLHCHQPPTEPGLDDNLPKDSSTWVHDWGQDYLGWDSVHRSYSIQGGDHQLHNWSPDPDQWKHCNPIHNGRKEQHWNAQEYDKDVVDDKLDVLVCDAQDFMKRRVGDGVSVLLKTILKLQLQKKFLITQGSLMVCFISITGRIKQCPPICYIVLHHLASEHWDHV